MNRACLLSFISKLIQLNHRPLPRITAMLYFKTFLLLGLTVGGLAVSTEYEGKSPIAYLTYVVLTAAGSNNLVERATCDCAAFTKCNSGCGAFNNAVGQAGGFCTSSCYSSSHCGQNTRCCKDGTSCNKKGCCAGHG